MSRLKIGRNPYLRPISRAIGQAQWTKLPRRSSPPGQQCLRWRWSGLIRIRSPLPKRIEAPSMLSSEALAGWRAFAGRSSGLPVKFLHKATGVEGPEWSREDFPRSHNTHITTFVSGKLLLQTMSSQIGYFDTCGFSARQYAEGIGFSQIWPIQSSTVGMPSRLSTDQDFDSCRILHLRLFGPQPLMRRSRGARSIRPQRVIAEISHAQQKPDAG